MSVRVLNGQRDYWERLWSRLSESTVRVNRLSRRLREWEPMTAHDNRSSGDTSAGKRLSVCHLGKFYPPAPGGIETHVRTLARAQARMGMDVSVLCINHLDRHGLDATWNRYGATST